MSELDDKLSKLISDLWMKDGRLDQERLVETVAELKQAFQDAGWTDHHKYSWSGDGTNTFTEVMTGQTFYDRFQAELYKKKFPFIEKADDYTTILMVVEDAARRVANINEQKETN